MEKPLDETFGILGHRGETLSTAAALIAGTARADAAVLVTDNLLFPVADIQKVTAPLE